MNETPTPVRPTKKQRQLLEFIGAFISEHGYSPSYREIMNSLNYNSVASVSLHVNSLIKRGHLKKREHAARSLELVDASVKDTLLTNEITPDQEKWLVEKVEHLLREAEQSAAPETQEIDNLLVLVGALKILGLEAAATSFMPRIKRLGSNLV